jgi:transcription elongation factor Elf1
MDITDDKYINLLSSRLEKFKKIKINLYNFRCPLCGDSQKNKNKTRAYLYSVKNNTNFKCHNCGASLSFNNFLKQLDPTLYKQFSLEKFKQGFTGKNFVVEEPKFDFKKPIFRKKIDLPKASENEISKKYLESRLLDSNQFYFAEKFKQWTNTQKQTFDIIRKDESRIIIPLYDFEGSLIGFQGRALGSSNVKYITVMLNEDSPKIYGLNNLNLNEEVYVTEGPFDSTFVENSIALCGADGDLKSLGIRDYVWIYDNEPRNIDIVRRIEKCINNGEKVIIWPTSIKQKDINDLIISGMTKSEVMQLIEQNIYSGVFAKLKLNQWKKC